MIEYPKKVLLATDATADSAKAANVAAALAGHAASELHVIHVGQPTVSAAGGTAMRPPLPGEPPGYAERQARKLLDWQVEQIEASGGGVAEAHLRMGQPAAEIIALAVELGVDLLVVGSGGPRPVRRAVAATTRQAAIGRASGVIVRSAPCPVLVVRGDGLLDVPEV